MQSHQFTQPSECFLCSWPQSGRTWLRFMMAAYFNHALSLGVDLDLNTVFTLLPNEGRNEDRGVDAFAFQHETRVPRIVATHKPWRPKLFEGQTIIFLLRSPHDALLSTFRGIEWRTEEGISFEQFLLEDERGVLALCQYLNSWAANLDHCEHVAVSYEQMIANAAKVLRRILQLLNMPVQEESVHAAVEYSRYDNMKRLNQTRGIGGKEGPRTDDDLLRVREGVVGKHKTDLTDEQNQFVSDVLALALTDRAKSLVRELTECVTVPTL